MDVSTGVTELLKITEVTAVPLLAIVLLLSLLLEELTPLFLEALPLFSLATSI
jgi:hypothetical protein